MFKRLLGAVTASLAIIGCGDSPVVDPDPGAMAVEAAAPSAQAATATRADARLAGLHTLPTAFHAALNASDKEAVRALWAPDAVVWAGPIGCAPCTGPDEIADAFAQSGPFVNGWAALTPSYKTLIERHGSVAEYEFECVYLPDSGDLGPPAAAEGQTVTAHLNATGTMRKVRGRWVFQTLQAGPGAL